MRLSRGFLLRFLLPATLIVAAAGIWGCSRGGGDHILIGHYASLTGEISDFGNDTDRGVKLAEAEVNQAGGFNGKPFRVQTQDDRSDPQEAVTVVTGFANNPNVVAVLGEVASSISKAAAPVLQNARIPMVSPSSTNPEVTAVGDYIFRVCFIDPFQGYVMAKFARDNLKLDRVAILRDQKNDYSVGLANEFRKNFEQMGGRIVSDVSYKAGDSDFRSQLSRVRGTNPQALYVPGYYGEVGNIARQARELGLNVPLMGGDGWDSPQLVTGAGGPGGALEGSYFSNHYSKDDQSPRVREFVQAYRARFNTDPSGLAALGYDAMKILADAIRRAGSTDRQAIRDALAQTRSFPGVTGEITIDENRNARKPAVILQIQGNEFVYRQTVSPPDAAEAR